MIKSFKHKGLEQYFTKDSKRLLHAKDLPKIDRILDRLDTAIVVEDMNIPSWDLHELKGNRKGTWSIAVRNNWKITFSFEKGDVYNVNLEDYH
ncbi:MAG TPA: type II toxin-antitoxin system RelE/ParE family toxin [Gammaproteobacteria bacterium]|nr:type II toxin-antitoxin system RelE/ParE family toxin [Gammaproteobacteria bacterium]